MELSTPSETIKVIMSMMTPIEEYSRDLASLFICYIVMAEKHGNFSWSNGP